MNSSHAFGSVMHRTPSISSASSSTYTSSVYQPSPVASPRMSHQEPAYDHSTIALNRLSMKLGHLQPHRRPRPSPLAQQHASKVARGRNLEKYRIPRHGSPEEATKGLKNPVKAAVEKDRRNTNRTLLGKLQSVIHMNNPNLEATAAPREFRREGGLGPLKRNNIKHAYAATVDKKDVMEISLIQLQQDNIVFDDVVQELQKQEYDSRLWQSEMQALLCSGTSQEALSECLDRRPVLNDLPARIRYSLARRAGRDFQSPAQLKQ